MDFIASSLSESIVEERISASLNIAQLSPPFSRKVDPVTVYSHLRVNGSPADRHIADPARTVHPDRLARGILNNARGDPGDDILLCNGFRTTPLYTQKQAKSSRYSVHSLTAESTNYNNADLCPFCEMKAL